MDLPSPDTVIVASVVDGSVRVREAEAVKLENLVIPAAVNFAVPSVL
jgi:hypothetical protein